MQRPARAGQLRRVLAAAPTQALSDPGRRRLDRRRSWRRSAPARTRVAATATSTTENRSTLMPPLERLARSIDLHSTSFGGGDFHAAPVWAYLSGVPSLRSRFPPPPADRPERIGRVNPAC